MKDLAMMKRGVEEFSFTQCRLQLTVGEETKENARGFEV
jgi:hypothetical protein